MAARVPSLTIDLHTHILPADLPDLVERYGYGGFVRLDHVDDCCARLSINGRPFRDLDDRCWNPERRLEDCEHAGVDVQVLSTVPVLFSYWAKPADAHDLARILNDHLVAVIDQHPERFAGLATLPMQDPELAIQELERVTTLGLHGIQIGTHVNGHNLDDPGIEAVLRRASELGVAVFVHPWDMLGADRMKRFWFPWLVGMPCETALAICSLMFGGILDRLPALRVGFAHGGGAFPGTLGRIQHGFEARPDLCQTETTRGPREQAERIYVDSLVHDAGTLTSLVHTFGAGRVALGSDYPFPLGEAVPGALIRSLADVEDDVRARLLGGTAVEFLGVDPSRFVRDGAA